MWRRQPPAAAAVVADSSLMGLLVDAFGPLEPNTRSPLAVLLCVLCWELLYRVSQLACVVLAPVIVRAGHTKGATAFRNNGCTYVVAFVHALLTGGRGLWHIWSLLGAPLDDKLATSLDPLSPFHAAAVATEFTGLLFLSWLIYDIIHVLAWWPVRTRRTRAAAEAGGAALGGGGGVASRCNRQPPCSPLRPHHPSPGCRRCSAVRTRLRTMLALPSPRRSLRRTARCRFSLRGSSLARCRLPSSTSGGS